MAVAIPTNENAQCTNCPPRHRLRALIHGDVQLEEQHILTEHIGQCETCQNELDILATRDFPAIINSLSQINQTVTPTPPALSDLLDHVAKNGLAELVAGQSEDSDDLKLDFLNRSEHKHHLGRLSSFDVLRIVGRGGMGVVLHAYDASLDRDVAIKVLDPLMATNRIAKERFCREARAAAAVNHQNIVSVYQVNEETNSGLPYLVMELVQGVSLEQYLKDVGRLSVEEAVRLGVQAASGLAAAHSVGLIHRDIKPGNILIEKNNFQLKITDFGLARAAEDLKLTRTGYVSGTPLYMAPEQASGEEFDHRVDLFSLGVVMYEALAGNPPFDGKSPLAVLRRIAEDPHEPLSEVRPDVPHWLETIIDKLLAKSKEDRFHSATDLMEALLHRMPEAKCQSKSDTALKTAKQETCPLVPPEQLSANARKIWRMRMGILLLTPFLSGLVLGAGAMWMWNPAPEVVSPATPNPSADVVTNSLTPSLSTPVEAFAGNSGAVWSVAVCPDGETLAMGLEDGSIMIYNIPTNRVRRTLTEHKGPIWDISFLPDGKQFISASDDGTIRLWNLEKTKSTQVFENAVGVRSLAVNRFGTYMATGDRAGKVKIWNLKDTAPSHEFDHGGSVHSVAFSRDAVGMTVASAGSDKTAKVWDVTRDNLQMTLSGSKGPVYAVTFSPDDRIIAIAGWDGFIRLYESASGTEIKKLAGHQYDVWSLDFSDCGLILASAGQDGTVHLWDIMNGTEIKKYFAHQPVAHVVRFSNDCKTVISGGRDGFVRMWDSGKQ